MRTLPLFLLLLLSACRTPEPSESIHVIGVASQKVVPDMVEMSLKAYTVKPAMRDAVAGTQAAVDQILAVCRKYVQHPDDIKISHIATNKAWEYRNGQEVFVGYDALQVLSVTLRDIRRMEQFTEALLATQISKIEGIRYNHTKADSISREVSLLALQDARRTAEKMCGQMGVPLGRITHLSNFADNQSMKPGQAGHELNLYSKSFGGQGFRMTAEILEFTDQAFASFSLR